MHYKNITCIINPSSGKDTPILGAINTAVQKSDATWRLNITQKKGDITRYAEKGIERSSDLIIVYGGDGSVMEAARVLISHDIPMLILPGGTANVISKELHIPQDANAVFKLLLEDRLQTQTLDMGTVDELPFLLRVNFGIFADMIKKTNAESKQNLGQLAYGLTAASSIQQAKPQQYIITLDTETITTNAVGVMVTNIGSVGIGTFSLNQNINSNDGLLDVIVMENTDFGSIFNLAASTFSQANLEGSIKHYQSTQVHIKPSISQSVICDDEVKTFTDYKFSIEPAALKVLIPKKV